MKTSHILTVLFLVGVFGVAVAGGQELAQVDERHSHQAQAGEIPNWSAPATWTPTRPNEGLTTMGAVTSPLPFIGLQPCRVADTRGNGAPIQGGIFANSEARNWTVAGICGIPTAAQAISVNFTVVAAGGIPAGSFLLAWPTGSPPVQTTAIMTYGPGQIISNAAIAPLNNSGQLTVNVSGSTQIIMDTNGYYAPAGVGNNNTFLGLGAGNFTMTGDFNTGIGYNALHSNASGMFNTAIGFAALPSNTSANSNTAIGSQALVFNTGGGNTAIGAAALGENVTGNSNTAIGIKALEFSTGSNNIGIGASAGDNQTTGSHDIYIGNFGVNGESNTIRIGDASFQDGGTIITGISGANSIGGAPVFVTSGGRLGTVTSPSARRFKQDIRDIAEESDGLMRLRPVAFKYKPEIDATGTTQYGLIAEEVAEVYPHLVGYDRDGQLNTVRYHLLPALLLNELQKQHRTAEAQEKTIEQQKAVIEVLEARLSRLEARLLAESRP